MYSNTPSLSLIGSIKTRTRSKDSGVDGLTDSGVDNMIDSKTRPFEDDEDEFSDISESNDGSMDNEVIS